MSSTAPTAIRLSVTPEIRRALSVAKKHYPTLSDPEILKLGLSKIVTGHAETTLLASERNNVRRSAAYAAGKDYLSDPAEDVYTAQMGKKVRFL